MVYAACRDTDFDLNYGDDDFHELMVAFWDIMSSFGNEPWYADAANPIHDAEYDPAPAYTEVARTTSRASSETAVAGLVGRAPSAPVVGRSEDGVSSHPLTRAASARRSPLAAPMASGSGTAGDPMVVDSAEVRSFLP